MARKSLKQNHVFVWGGVKVGGGGGLDEEEGFVVESGEWPGGFGYKEQQEDEGSKN